MDDDDRANGLIMGDVVANSNPLLLHGVQADEHPRRRVRRTGGDGRHNG